MKREFLKGIIEGITEEQLTKILDANGNEVSEAKAKVDELQENLRAVTTERDGLKNQIAQRDSDLADLQKKVEGQTELETQLRESKEKYENDTKQLKAQIEQQATDFKKENFLNTYKYSSVAAKEGIKAAFDKKGFKLDDNGVFIGAKEYMDSLMSNEDYKGAFVFEQKNTDPVPPEPNHPKFSTTPTTPPPAHKKTSLQELMQKKNENPNMAVNFD